MRTQFSPTLTLPKFETVPLPKPSVPGSSSLPEAVRLP